MISDLRWSFVQSIVHPMSQPAAPTSRKRSKKWIWLPLILLVAGASVSAMMLLHDPATTKTSQTPAVVDKPTGVGSRGRIEPEDGVIFVAAPYFSGRPSIISELRIKEGGWLQSGQIIGIVEGAPPLEKALKQSEAEVEVARTRLAQLRAGLKTADIDEQKQQIARWETEYDLAAKDLQRYEGLRDNQLASLADVDQKRLIAERAKRTLDAAKERLKSMELVRQEDIEVLNAELTAAMARVEQNRAELERVIIRAPFSGRVLKIHAYPGEEVGPEGVLELAKTDRMYVVAEVYETDIGRIHIGQKAVISGELFPDRLAGTVTRIDPQISKSELLPTEPTAFADTRVIKVRIQLENSERVAGLIYGKVDVVIQ